MWFPLKKKGQLKKEFDDKLLSELERLKEDWMMKKKFLSQSIEPSEDLVNEFKVLEAKYLYLLREAKHRKVSGNYFKS